MPRAPKERTASSSSTKFKLFLPLVEMPEFVAVEAEPEEVAKRDLSGKGTLLLVEDEDAVRSFGARALRNKGYHVLEANSGESAIDVLAECGDDVDLIITDVVTARLMMTCSSCPWSALIIPRSRS